MTCWAGGMVRLGTAEVSVLPGGAWACAWQNLQTDCRGTGRRSVQRLPHSGVLTPTLLQGNGTSAPAVSTPQPQFTLREGTKISFEYCFLGCGFCSRCRVVNPPVLAEHKLYHWATAPGLWMTAELLVGQRYTLNRTSLKLPWKITV